MQGLFGGSAPQPRPMPAMPDPQSPDVLAARAKALRDDASEGRNSTVLTRAARSSSAAQTLAGGYGASKLGSAA